MDLLISDAHIQYYHEDANWSKHLGHTYFANLIVKIQVATAIQHPDTTLINGQQIDIFTKFFHSVAASYSRRGSVLQCSYHSQFIKEISNYDACLTLFC